MVDMKYKQLNISKYLEAVGIKGGKVVVPGEEVPSPSGGALIVAPPELFNASQY